MGLDAAGRGGAVAGPAPRVGPHVHVDLHEAGWLLAALSQGAPTGNRNSEEERFMLVDLIAVIICNECKFY